MVQKLLNRCFHSFKQWLLKRKYKKALHQAAHALHQDRASFNELNSPSTVEEREKHTSFLELKNAVGKMYQEISTPTEESLERARPLYEQITRSLHSLPKKSYLRVFSEFVFALLVAILLAGIIRQVWFELYEIPTGSMRPTFKEQDRVLVSKSSFGINIPFTTGHFLFSPNLIQRGTIGVITGEGLDLPDVDTVYFGLFPGKRRYVKRIVGLPGDWVYFYGGDVYCLEKDSKTIRHLKADPLFKSLEYIPFIHFEGKTELVKGSRFGRQKTVEIKQMNIPIARVEYSSQGSIESFIRFKEDGKDTSWIRQFSESKKLFRSMPQTIGDFWGIKNFAKSRLILPEELPPIALKLGYSDPKALAWLELYHSPVLPETSGKDTQGRMFVPPILTSRTWIPLYEEHCDRLMNGLYTARFVIDNGFIHRYHYEGAYKESQVKPPKPLKDGTYEFYYGKAYEIASSGRATELDEATHDLYPKTVKELIFWYNIGIDMNEEYLSRSPSSPLPTRFTYFKDGDLYSMGVAIIEKDDPVLKRFEENEITRQAKDYSYFAFQDSGSPLKNNDNKFFQTYGFKIPEKHYLLLGDNHAMSVDSRYFGVVPEENIQGSPVFLFWPFGKEWGSPLQPSRPFGMVSIYSLGIIIFTLSAATWISIIQKRQEKRELEEISKDLHFH